MVPKPQYQQVDSIKIIESISLKKKNNNNNNLLNQNQNHKKPVQKRKRHNTKAIKTENEVFWSQDKLGLV